MKRILSKLLSKLRYNLVSSPELSSFLASRQKINELIIEHYHFARSSGLSALQKTLPTPVFESLSRLIGTGPFEGLYILDSLYRTKNLKGEICEFGIAQGATSQLLGTFILEESSKKN